MSDIFGIRVDSVRIESIVNDALVYISQQEVILIGMYSYIELEKSWKLEEMNPTKIKSKFNELGTAMKEKYANVRTSNNVIKPVCILSK